MQVTTQAEFDSIMADPLTNISTTIEFPGGTVDWRLNITKLCTIFGNNTTINPSGLGIDIAMIVSAAIDISDLTVINTGKTAISMNGVQDARFEKIRAGYSNIGWLIKDSRNNEFEECESYNNATGIELQGSSSIIGDIDSYQEFGLIGLSGEEQSGLIANKQYYFIVGGKEYKLSTGEYTSWNNLVQQLNDAKRVTDGQALKADYLATLTGGDIRITSLTNATVSLARGTSGSDLLSYISGFDTRKQTTIEFIADSNFSLQSKYWLFNTHTSQYYVWYNVGLGTGGGTDPLILNKTGLKVNIIDNESANQVAQKTKLVLDDLKVSQELDISIINNILTITSLKAGDHPDSTPVDTGFIFSKIDGALDGSFDISFGNTLEEDRTDRCHLNIFNACLVHDNSIGIKLINANHNQFLNCKTYENTNIGLWQLDVSYDNIYRGEIFQNIKYGVRNTDRDHSFDASSIWWGDVTGPSGGGRGEGDKTSSYVLIEPWLQSGTEPELTYPVTRNFMWNMLGYPQVAVEMTEDQMGECINVALEKYHYYWQPEPYYHYLDVGVGQRELELPAGISKENIIEVNYSPNNDIFSQLSGSGESFFLTYYMQQSGGTFLADFYVAMAYKETFERTLGIQPSYEFVSHPDVNGIMKDYIRLYPSPSSHSIKVALKVSRTLSEAEVDQEMWIRKYALAWAKQMLGQIRSKFASVPGPTGEVSIKGDALIQEGKDEEEKLVLDLIKRSEPLGFIMG